jgi:hypothetical protein
MDCFVRGRHSFEKVLSFPEWSYAAKQFQVLSRRLNILPDVVSGLAEFATKLTLNGLSDFRKSLEWHRTYFDGGEAAGLFLQQGLVRQLTLN